jgi:hypothetical protein
VRRVGEQRIDDAAQLREIIRRNGFESRIHIINKMSTECQPEEVAAYGMAVPIIVTGI